MYIVRNLIKHLRKKELKNAFNRNKQDSETLYIQIKYRNKSYANKKGNYQ